MQFVSDQLPATSMVYHTHRNESIDPHSSMCDMRAVDGWDAMDIQLNQWSKDLSDIVDCDATPPSKDVIRLARSYIARFRQKQMDPPAMIVPDGNGGIAFEWHFDRFFRLLEITKDEQLWLSEYQGGRLRSRGQIKN